MNDLSGGVTSDSGVANYDLTVGHVTGTGWVASTPLQVASIAEDAAAGTVVTVLHTADADAADSFSYNLTSDPSGLFEIVGDEIRLKAAAHVDYETASSHSLGVQVTDLAGNHYSEMITVRVTEIHEFNVTTPVGVNAAANIVAENAANDTTVGIAAFTSDADATHHAVTYSLSDNAGGRFAINATTGVVTVAGAIDTEAGASYDIGVRATSVDGSTATQNFTINVADADEFDATALADTDASANTVTENAAHGTVIGITAGASDADATNNAVTYNLSNSAGGRFAIDAATGVVKVADGSLLDYERHQPPIDRAGHFRRRLYLQPSLYRHRDRRCGGPGSDQRQRCVHRRRLGYGARGAEAIVLSDRSMPDRLNRRSRRSSCRNCRRGAA